MKATLREQRLKLAWLLAPVFIYWAQPTASALLAGAFLVLAGLILRGAAANSIHKDRSLAVGGPYAHLRHPLYLGSFFVGLGFAVAGGRVAFMVLFPGLFFWVYRRTVLAEEAEMEDRFGEAYLSYRSQVPGLIPRLHPYAAGMDGSPVTTAREGGHFAEDDLDPALPSGSLLRLYRRNNEWEALLGSLGGFGILGLRMLFF